MKLFPFMVFLFYGFMGYAQNYTKDYLEVDYQSIQTEKQNYTFRNLRLYPIKANQRFLKQSENWGNYTPLKEALANKTIVITETENQNISNVASNPEITQNQIQRQVQNQVVQQQTQNAMGNIGSAQVNKLLIENTSQDTIYIMAGEVVQGGKQDRVIAQDMVIPPNSGKMDMSVFCVEHGRWNYKKGNQFEGYFGVTSMAMRGVVTKEQNQQKVWKEVNRSNTKIKVESKTQAYTERNKSTDFQVESKAYTDFFLPRFKTENDIVGVVVVTGNRVAGCDIFATPDLFQSQFSSLLSSYINEAITDGDEVSITQENVENYMNQLLENEQNQQKFLKKKGKLYQNKEKKLHISTY